MPRQTRPTAARVTPRPASNLDGVLRAMHAEYVANPTAAVRSQKFIKRLHAHFASELEHRLTPWAKRRGIRVIEEANVFGSHKAKNIDVAVIDPISGPLLAVGVRSQMSSIGNNVLTYYQDVVGEATSLQERFPMCTYGYAYLHPKRSMLASEVNKPVDHPRFARLYEAISGRDGRAYAQLRGVYDEFAYLVVDFDSDPPLLHDDIAEAAVSADLSANTLVNRLIEKFAARTIWLDVFAPLPPAPSTLTVVGGPSGAPPPSATEAAHQGQGTLVSADEAGPADEDEGPTEDDEAS